MKRIFTTILLALCAVLSVEAADREHTLKIYNWADYIDESVLDDFKVWYKEQTGEEVEIIYQLFDINEIMLAKIERGNEDFDVVCPSEYIIERMLRNNMLLPIDKDFGQTPNYLQYISPYITECFNKIDGSGKNANDYAVGYMWGTTGFLYNKRYVSQEEVSTWSALWNPKFNKKLLIKDAFRDVYSPLLIYANQDRLKAGEVTMQDLMHDSSDEAIATVEALLKKAKPYVAGWEADFGKEIMTKETAWLNLSWSGDAQWSIEEAATVGVELDYTVPKEGSVVWFDGWVIPKYAKNVKAASYFINFMCMPENAIRNMEEIGYVSVISSPEVLDYMTESAAEAGLEQPQDLTYFFGEDADSVVINPVMYPDRTVIERCAMMHDSGSRTEALLAMWSRVKGDNLNNWMVVVILLVFGALLVVGIFRKMKQRRQRRRRW